MSDGLRAWLSAGAEAALGSRLSVQDPFVAPGSSIGRVTHSVDAQAANAQLVPWLRRDHNLQPSCPRSGDRAMPRALPPCP